MKLFDDAFLLEVIMNNSSLSKSLEGYVEILNPEPAYPYFKTCAIEYKGKLVLPVTLSPNRSYRLAIKTPTFEGFTGPRSVPSQYPEGAYYAMAFPLLKGKRGRGLSYRTGELLFFNKYGKIVFSERRIARKRSYYWFRFWMARLGISIK